MLLIQDQHIPHLLHGGEENGQSDLIPGVGSPFIDGIGKEPVLELPVGPLHGGPGSSHRI